MIAIRQNGWQLAAIQAGGAICLPVLVVGHLLAINYGELSAYLAIGLGNGLLLLLGIIAAIHSVETRQSTAECAVECFGNRGRAFFALAMVCSMIGWFAIQLHLMAISFDQLIHLEGGKMSAFFLGTLMTFFGMRGIKGVGFLANISLPLLIVTIGYAVMNAGERSVVSSPHSLMSTAGVSLVLACSVGAVIDLPTFFRFARSKRDALFALVLLFGVTLPLLEGVGVFLYSRNQGGNFLEVLLAPPYSGLWELWVLGFVMLAGWTTNSANLYSAVVSLQTALPKLSLKQGTLLLGCLGTLLSCFDLSTRLESILEPIGILLGSMGAVMLVCFLFGIQEGYNKKIFAWAVGTLAGFLSFTGFSLTEITVLDAFLGSFLTMGVLLIASATKRLVYENN